MYHDMGHNSCFKITKDLKEDKNNMKLPCIDRNADYNVLEMGRSQTPNLNNTYRLNLSWLQQKMIKLWPLSHKISSHNEIQITHMC